MIVLLLLMMRLSYRSNFIWPIDSDIHSHTKHWFAWRANGDELKYWGWSITRHLFSIWCVSAILRRSCWPNWPSATDMCATWNMIGYNSWGVLHDTKEMYNDGWCYSMIFPSNSFIHIEIWDSDCICKWQAPDKWCVVVGNISLI